MGKKKYSSIPKRTNFYESGKLNNNTYWQYYHRLMELSISMFEWKNLPDTIDQRFLELTLFTNGTAVFFKDDVMGYLGLQCMVGGKLDVYNIPVRRTAFATSGYRRSLTEDDSVIIFNNMLHTNSITDVELYARRLEEIDRTIDVNVRAQKTPVLIKCSENERLSMMNLYKEYDGNSPVIFGDDSLNSDALSVLRTDAPYMADKLYQLKTQIWNEALTYLGISNVNITKRERLITDEVTRNMGGTIASRYSRLESRRQACEQINKMFGLDIWCDYREDYQAIELKDGSIDSESQTESGEANNE